jgi:phosphoglycolate phosphatase-like HAD superfamily hydrolase
MDSPQVFALDFDGVICDGIEEYWQTAWLTYRQIWQLGGKKPSNAMSERFKELRPTIEVGWEMPILIHALMLGIEKEQISSDWQRTRDRVMAESRISPLDVGKKLDGVRDDWIRRDLEGWLSLHRFYPGVIETLKRLLDRQLQVIIITTKEGRFVRELLQKQGVNLPPKSIWGKEVKRSKADSLRLILDEVQASSPQISFVEDRLQTVNKVAARSDLDAVKLYLADWGYNTTAERNLAAANPKIQILSLTDFSHLG